VADLPSLERCILQSARAHTVEELRANLLLDHRGRRRRSVATSGVSCRRGFGVRSWISLGREEFARSHAAAEANGMGEGEAADSACA
jgi:S-ribosylhomocysteine lyase LuxS involved in autoinducer biosynthesis